MRLLCIAVPFACALMFAAPLAAQAAERELFAARGADLQQPQLAVRSDGALALAFADGGKTLRVAVRLPKGDWQTPHTVVASPDFAVGMHRGPRVAWSGEALLVSAIEARFDASTKTMHGCRDLRVWRSADLGATWSVPVTVNGEPGSAAEGLHALAANGEHVAIAWLDARGEPKGGKLWSALSNDGGGTFGREFVAHASPNGICPCCHPSLAIGADGVAIAMWRDAIAGNRDLWFGALADGKAIAAPRQAGREHWQLDACPMDGGGIALAGDGRVVTAWRRDSTVWWTLADGRERSLGDGRNPTIAAHGTRALAAWERGSAIACAVLDLDPKSLDLAPKVEELGAGSYPTIAALADGTFVIVAERRGERGGRLVQWTR